ncbi:response regulator [Flavobacterium sp.]|uniref:response regulator n=1 Tax=Flavobacterium sp. TaxID=239 RepID=UPI002D0A6A5C|nr:response regulator [Flavobacterium sp.]HSD07419.1 response regulator [Flavobacterium sp.]
MNRIKYNILLADDDEDDCDFFKDALDELQLPVNLVIVNDGQQLMNFLLETSIDNLPDLLFLDLNMPKKSGFECLTEIRQIDKLKNLPVIIFSTSLNNEIVDLTYKNGAIHYIQKPGEFPKLKRVIENALITTTKNNFKQPIRDYFILQP